MEVFRDLFISGNAQQRDAILAVIERSLSDGWSRDRATEEKMRGLVLKAKLARCFTHAGAARRPAATLFLAEAGNDTLYVSNIVPHERSQLSYGDYNDLVTDFFERFVRPNADQAGVKAELTKTDVELEHWLSPEAAEKLRRFSAAANRSTGASHPLDRQRWLDFLVTAYQDGARLDGATLRRWLIEIEGWPPEVADQLAGEYEFGRDLTAFTSQRRGA